LYRLGKVQISSNRNFAPTNPVHGGFFHPTAGPVTRTDCPRAEWCGPGPKASEQKISTLQALKVFLFVPGLGRPVNDTEHVTGKFREPAIRQQFHGSSTAEIGPRRRRTRQPTNAVWYKEW